ncbi:MAG TPA: hypothetical protein VKR06_13380 [Ktedonosporobacter sp.]|nr:hypothetical protein [Ktedonosporobacter sp.]
MQESIESTDVLIIGAGPTGLLLSCDAAMWLAGGKNRSTPLDQIEPIRGRSHLCRSGSLN